ncbi:hypothetical protein [Streptomyces radicis]|uniref:Uncharacterized protein n=1 Tax=Streptomyces radicis TaxID=1750517 RepID=A0A3A9WDW6_9ACTN|nr:hypothetical protein [Streptomyces radicis]RKN10979.1 hypothetical protein D7319_07550 [Streptomyces radicis]RKN25242.1 hypothetical protein D7318_08405 [Streptomyces radicis]
MDGDVKLDSEEADLVTAVIAQAYEDMEEQARQIGGHSESVSFAYQGSGTTRAMETYSALGGAGAALAAALDGLSQDLGLTVAEGHDMDANALSALNQGAGAVGDPVIANAF